MSTRDRDPGLRPPAPPPVPEDRSGQRTRRRPSRRPSGSALRLFEVVADEIRAVILGGLGRVFDEGLRQGEAELAGARRALEEAVAQNVLLQAERQHLHTRLEGMGVELAAAEADRDAVLAELYDADPTARGRWRTRLDTKRQSLRELDELIRASEKPPKGPT